MSSPSSTVTASFCRPLLEINSGRKHEEECKLSNWRVGKEMPQLVEGVISISVVYCGL